MLDKQAAQGGFISEGPQGLYTTQANPIRATGRFFPSLNRHLSTADGYYCPLLKLYYSIFLSVALCCANPPWWDGRQNHIKLFMTLASILFCLMIIVTTKSQPGTHWVGSTSTVCPTSQSQELAAAPEQHFTCCKQNLQDQLLFEANAFKRGSRMM